MSPKAFGDDRDADFAAWLDGAHPVAWVRRALGGRFPLGGTAHVHPAPSSVAAPKRSGSTRRGRATRRWLRQVTRECQREHVAAMSAVLGERIVSGSALSTVAIRGGTVRTGAVLVFDDDIAVGLSVCHAPTLAVLTSAAGESGTTTLVRARHHDTFWALYFHAGEMDVAVLAADVYPVPARR